MKTREDAERLLVKLIRQSTDSLEEQLEKCREYGLRQTAIEKFFLGGLEKKREINNWNG